MERIHISLSEEDVTFLDKKCKLMNITRSEYIRYILYYVENDLPMKDKNINLIRAINNLDIEIKRLLLGELINDYDKIKLHEQIKSIKQSVERFT